MARALDQAHRRKKNSIKGKGNTHEATCVLSVVSGVFKTLLLLYEISTEDILKIHSMFDKKHQLMVVTSQIQQLCKYQHTEAPVELHLDRKNILSETPI